MEKGDIVKNFELNDESGHKVSFNDFNKWRVVYFYPKDDTPGCTIEAIDFTKHLADFEKEGATILGISPDEVASHVKFIEKHNLTIKLLADPEKDVLRQFGVWGMKKFMGREFMGVKRSTFLIDPKGKVAHLWHDVSVKGHAEAVLEKLKELK